ncbi:MAG: hypothetical protein XU14_C0033G0025 [Armatimonadetes bacterium CSP1-3]|nr:MAG: hypothetical protein XU14_C0033G0025 [Armatimonadetes bacterium CSP1-3]
MSEHECWLHDPYGNRLALLDTTHGFGYARVVNSVGWWGIELPGDFDDSLLKIDGIVEFWRKPQGGALALQISGTLRVITESTDAQGVDKILIEGPDVNELLERRIVAYAAASSQADKTDQADDMLKAIARENLGSSATAARNLTALGFTVHPDLAAGPSVTRGFAWREVSRVYREIVDASAGLGTDLYWEIVPVSPTSFELRTYTGQPGVDRSYGSGSNPVLFGLLWGNLADPKLTRDYSQEITTIYAGGQGEEASRLIVEVSDATRLNRSPWNRREAFADARNERDTDGVTAIANARLNDGKPRLRFSGKLLDTPQAVYGKDWNFGDRVTVEYRGRQLDGLVNAVTVKVDGEGNETVEARFEVEDAIA